MSATVATEPAGRTHGRRFFASAGLLVAATIIVLGNSDVAAGEHGGLGPALATGGICLVLAGLLFGLVLPRTPGSPAVAVLGVLTVLSLAVFWSGAVGVLAGATWAVRDQPATRGSRVAVGAATAAAALALTVSVVGFVA